MRLNGAMGTVVDSSLGWVVHSVTDCDCRVDSELVVVEDEKNWKMNPFSSFTLGMRLLEQCQ